jgi:hypothetical protein
MNGQELKTALANHDFDRAQALVPEWGKMVLTDMRSASGEAELRRILDGALAFAEDHVHLARVIRAHIASDLEANSASFLYRDADLEQHRWQLKA